MIGIWAFALGRLRRDGGATMVEYALILLSILIVVVIGAALVGTASNVNYVDVEACMNASANC